MLLVVFSWMCDDDAGDVSVCRFGWMVEATLAGRCSWMGEDSCGHKLGVFYWKGRLTGGIFWMGLSISSATMFVVQFQCSVCLLC